jgi:hypothetical protein
LALPATIREGHELDCPETEAEVSTLGMGRYDTFPGLATVG